MQQFKQENITILLSIHIIKQKGTYIWNKEREEKEVLNKDEKKNKTREYIERPPKVAFVIFTYTWRNVR